MMENLLKANKTEPIPQITKTTPAAKPAEAVKFSGPPPTAPKGPASSRPIFRPSIQSATALAPPTKPKPVRVVASTEPVSQLLLHQPYIFVAGDSVPLMNTTPPHMLKRMRHFAPEDVKMDTLGYYITFPNSHWGRNDCERCFRTLNLTLMFNYTMVMQPYPYGSSGSRSAAHRTTEVSRKRSRSPSHRDMDEWDRQAEIARRKEEAADVEEERKERAMNFDPSREAIEVIRRELKTQLVKNIRTKTAAPILHEFLDPVKHLAKRRKLNIPDPKDMKLQLIHEDDEREDSPSVGTPNSRNESFERRAMAPARLNISAMPRIRKAKSGTKPNVGFKDPFTRSRPPPKKPLYRSLVNRYLVRSDDDDSDDDNDVRSRIVDTEEPDSRPRSRMTSEEGETEDDILRSRIAARGDVGSVDTRDEDSMSEVSLAIGDTIPSKKRKLDLQVEASLKRQKKTDEELFGVGKDKINQEFPLSASTIDEESGQIGRAHV